MSYVAHAKSRPLRIAFVVPAVSADPSSDTILDSIVTASQGLWGGRFNPLVVVDGENDLASDEWREIEKADPDRVHAFFPLTEPWVERFDQRLFPWAINDESKRWGRSGRPPDTAWNSFPIDAPGVAISPSPNNLQQFGDRKLLALEFGSTCPIEIRRFFHRNYGTYFQYHDAQGNVRRDTGTEKLLLQSNREIFRINDLTSACQALEKFAGSLFPPNFSNALAFIAPCEVSSLGLGAPFPQAPYTHTYRVFVGNHPRDFAAYWNEMRIYGCWQQPYRIALWIPQELISSGEFLGALQKLLFEYSGQHSQGSRHVQITSETVLPEDLSRVAEILDAGNSRVPTEILASDERRKQIGEYFDQYDVGNVPRSMVSTSDAFRFRIMGQSETHAIPKPEVVSVNGSWAVDLQIDLADSRSTSSRWWCLPRRSGSYGAPSIFKAPARVNRTHQFSVEVERQVGPMSRNIRPEIHVHMPSESSVALNLLVGGPRPFNSDDARREQANQRSIVQKWATSEKGNYLRGLIELFGSFWTAGEFLERRFWREVFLKLAGHEPDKEAKLGQLVADYLVKKLPPTLGVKKETVQKQSPMIGKGLINRIHNRLNFSDQPLSLYELRQFLGDSNTEAAANKITEYRSGNTIVDVSTLAPLSDDDLQAGVDRLLALNILRSGAEIRCRNCGIPTWVHVDQLRQRNECAGCGFEHAVASTIEWKFRLNTLAQRCVSQNVLAVLQALVQIADNAYHSFFYVPNVDLVLLGLATPCELDIICVVDGKLVIGEVKDGDFDESDFERLAQIAELLRPDRAAIFVPHAYHQKAAGWFETFRIRLNRFGVEAELHALPAL